MKKFGIILAAALIALPCLAVAKDLTVSNNTKGEISVKVNRHCSNEFGVIAPTTSKTVAEEALKNLCGKNQMFCQAKVYKSKNCSGKQIADFQFDVKDGLHGYFHASENYTVTVSLPFNTFSIVEAL